MSKRPAKRKKRSGGKSRPLNRSVVPILGVVLLLLIGAGYGAYRHYQSTKIRAAYAQRWEIADRQFSRRGLQQAAVEYRKIQEMDAIDSAISDAPTVHKLAESMTQLCGAMEQSDLTAVDGLLQAIVASPETLEFAGEDQDILTRDERIDEIHRWAADEIRRLGKRLSAVSLSANLKSMDDARKFVDQWNDAEFDQARAALARWVDFAEPLGQPAAQLRQTLNDAEKAKRFRDSIQATLAAADGALASLNDGDVANASFQWESTKSMFPNLASETMWTDFRESLRDTIRNQFNGKQQTIQSAATGHLGDPSPDLPKRIKLSRLLTVPSDVSKDASQAASLATTEIIFARVHELCYALDSKTGATRWVVEMGYDAKWLPTLINNGNTTLACCVTLQGQREVISVLEAATGTTRWSIMLPPGVGLAGPPTAINRNLHLLLRGGQLWTLQIDDGSVVSQLDLPETSSNPLVVREDEQGVMAIGDQFGVYLIDVKDKPTVSDVVFPSQDANTTSRRGMWIPPYVVVFQNKLDENTYAEVFQRQGEQFQLVQSERVAGQLWDNPSIVGADFLLVTDAIDETIRHVDVDAPVEPIATRYRRQTPTSYPRRPYFLSHADAPFVAIRQSKVICYWVDPLASGGERKPIVRWEHSFPSEHHVATQPLRILGKHLYVAAQAIGTRAILIQALSLETGKPTWSLSLGGEVTTIRSDDQNAIARMDSGQLIHIRPDKESDDGTTHATIPIDSTDPTFQWIDEANAVLRFDASSQSLQVNKTDGTQIATQRVESGPASPLSVRVGPLRFVGQDSESRQGVWCAMIDAKSRFQIYPLSQNANSAAKQLGGASEILYHQLNEPNAVGFVKSGSDLPAGWFAPQWLDESSLLLANSDGRIIRVQLRVQGGVLFAAPDDDGVIKLGVLDQAPLLDGESIWVTTGSMLHQLDPQTLAIGHTVSLPSRATAQMVLSEDRLVIGLQNGRAAIINRDGKPSVLSIHQVSQRPLRLASVATQGIWLCDDQDTLWLLSQQAVSTGSGPAVSVATAPIRTPPIVLDGIDYMTTVSGIWTPITPIPVNAVPEKTVPEQTLP
ncbi:outer membrane protein assembly factor BamB family protein [Stieleria varia]|uniref:Pyrrolo-quinoline quinone repeat domain-containing protein n=1 Tax=Stieleria varia TaxID=2528005 RepID=A0A5C6B2H3_9BACT|nr:PQQ-binding-like beta-propeller repeat protein [Stieleria varia]TWU05619.1 hypothetical protein Pla52n_13340 [Stieleria varia]